MVVKGNKASISAALRWAKLPAFNYASQANGRKSGFVVNAVEGAHEITYTGPAPNRIKMALKYAEVLTAKGANVRVEGPRVLVLPVDNPVLVSA